MITTKLKTIGDDRYGEALNGSEGYRHNLDIVNRHLLVLRPEINRFLDRNSSIISMLGESVLFFADANGQGLLGSSYASNLIFTERLNSLYNAIYWIILNEQIMS